MDNSQSDGYLPQWAVNALVWFVMFIISITTGTIGWFTRKHLVKFDKLERNQGTFATKLEVAELELKIPTLISRIEFLAYMAQLREETERHYTRMSEERLRMHLENLGSIETVRTDIRAVHSRVDELYNKNTGKRS